MYRGTLTDDSLRALSATTRELGDDEDAPSVAAGFLKWTRWPMALAVELVRAGLRRVDGLGGFELSSISPGATEGEGPFVLWMVVPAGSVDEAAWAETTQGWTTGTVRKGAAELRWLSLDGGPEVARWVDEHLAKAELAPRSGPLIEVRMGGTTFTAEHEDGSLTAELGGGEWLPILPGLGI